MLSFCFLILSFAISNWSAGQGMIPREKRICERTFLAHDAFRKSWIWELFFNSNLLSNACDGTFSSLHVLCFVDAIVGKGAWWCWERTCWLLLLIFAFYMRMQSRATSDISQCNTRGWFRFWLASFAYHVMKQDYCAYRCPLSSACSHASAQKSSTKQVESCWK